MYKIDRRRGVQGGVQKSFSWTDPMHMTFSLQTKNVYFTQLYGLVRIGCYQAIELNVTARRGALWLGLARGPSAKARTG